MSKKSTTEPAKIGRPSKRTPEICAEICERLSTGEPLAAICRDDHMPDPSTVWDWAKSDPNLSQDIARARESGFDALAAQCIEIADDERHDWRMTKKGVIMNEVAVSRAKLQVETRLKLLAKWDPKRYGDKIDVNANHSGEVKIIIGGNA